MTPAERHLISLLDIAMSLVQLPSAHATIPALVEHAIAPACRALYGVRADAWQGYVTVLDRALNAADCARDGELGRAWVELVRARYYAAEEAIGPPPA